MDVCPKCHNKIVIGMNCCTGRPTTSAEVSRMSLEVLEKLLRGIVGTKKKSVCCFCGMLCRRRRCTRCGEKALCAKCLKDHRCKATSKK